VAQSSPDKTFPYVELHADLPERLEHLDQRVGSPAQQIEAALSSYRLLMINYAKQELRSIAEPRAGDLLRIMDLASQLYLKNFTKLVGPVAMAQYTKAFADARADEVPRETLFALAEEHADRMGRYFHDTSRDALAQGFNTYVNRRLPARAAADRVLDAFGLTPRQMSGYTSLDDPLKVKSANQISLKTRILDYIGRSFRSRVKIFSTQEMHNLNYQAKQTAWLWMQDKGQLSPYATKTWLTAKDERTCPVCAPMHGKSVKVADQFELPNGIKLWVPGVHPNCRCEIRINDLPSLMIQKDLEGGELKDFNQDHPRDEHGRFSAKSRARIDLERKARQAPQRFREIPVAGTELREDHGSPVIEEMLREVERLRKEPLQLEREEDTQLKPVSQLGSGRLKPLQQLRPMTPIKPPQTQLQTEHPQLNVTRKPLTAERRQLIAQQKQQLARKLQTVMAGVATPRRRIFIRPTTKVQDENGKTYPVWTVLESHEMDTHNERFEANTEMKWKPDYVKVSTEAAEKFMQNVHDQFNAITLDEGGRITKVAPDGNGHWHAFVDDDDIRDIIDSVAYDNGSDPDWHGENIPLFVSWYDDQGAHVKDDQVRYGEVANIWGLTPDLFRVYVLRMTEGHDSSLGRTSQISAGTKHGEEEWVTTGTYVLEDINTGVTDDLRRIPIIIAEAVPDVETEEFGDHPE
jgi:hypothetical protein